MVNSRERYNERKSLSEKSTIKLEKGKFGALEEGRILLLRIQFSHIVPSPISYNNFPTHFPS
jgi:hypothetical protein